MSQLKRTLRQTPLRSNLHIPILLSLNEDEDEWEADDFIYVGYRRPELVDVKIDNDADDLPEHIRWKLFLARQVALMKYREVHG